MKIGIKEMKKALLIVLGVSYALTLCLCAPALAKNARKDKIQANSGNTSGALKPKPTMLMHVGYRVSGRVAAASNGGLLEGRKVKIRIKKGGRTVFTQTKSLDHNGACTYEFKLMEPGTYWITVEKVATTAPPTEPTANICFSGTTPESRTVTLSSDARTAKNQDFTINFSIAFDRHGLCW